MASLGAEQQIATNNLAAETTTRLESREGSVERKAAKERDDKLKVARERQNEERQRKIEELKAQAEAAQRYREQKEEERRRRIDEIRQRDSEKRTQVEERKKAIMEAEKERREYILRKNQERESRIEVKKREKNSIGYAFGSSTPRLLEPSDFGMVSPSTFWGQRRSTSISNVAGASLSRRSSERELNDSGSKKRATSASGTERHDGSRSGTVTPGGHLNNSRPGSAMSTSTTMSTSGFINRRSVPTARKPRPASIAGTGVSLEEINKLKKDLKPPVKTSALSPSASAQTTPKRSTNMMSTSLIVTSSSSRLYSAEKKAHLKKELLTPKATTPKPLSKTASSDRLNKLSKEISKDLLTKSAIIPPVANRTTAKESIKSKEEKEAINQVKTEIVTNPSPEQYNGQKEAEGSVGSQQDVVITSQHEEKTDEGTEKNITESEQLVPQKSNSRSGSKEGSVVRELAPTTVDTNDVMTASMIAKSKITTEEEAKAALAERRRLAREEAERQAELERQRIEAERLAELKKQEEEAERQRQFEEEAMRLAEEQRKAEEERLRQAIEEAKQREEEEKRKREEEEKQRIEREEAEKKAKEEAEKQRIEVAERLKREEKEREERRKRVEAIMSRTRRGGANTTPNSTPTKESNNSLKPAEVALVSSTVAAIGSNTAKTVSVNEVHATVTAASINNTTNDAINSLNEVVVNSSYTECISTSGSSNSTATTPSTPASQQLQPQEQTRQLEEQQPIIIAEPQNTQAMYEQSVIDKENSLINSFSNMIIDENVKNIQQNLQQQQQLQEQFVVEETNGKIFAELQNKESNITTALTSVANGNGHHIESINNKNDIDLLQAVVPSTNQLIDLSLASQDNNVNFNNNNSLLTTTNTLVTADSHESKDILLL